MKTIYSLSKMIAGIAAKLFGNPRELSGELNELLARLQPDNGIDFDQNGVGVMSEKVAAIIQYLAAKQLAGRAA